MCKSIGQISFLDDIFEGLEFRPISCSKGIDGELLPKIKYITNRQATTDVNLNLDTRFLCGCTDNCQDKWRCAGWLSTIKEQSSTPNLEKKKI